MRIPTAPPSILIVDEHDDFRRVIQEVLKRQGFHVFEAAGAAGALGLVEHGIRPIDVLVIDIGMSPSRGDDLVERLRKLLPRLKVLYLSGLPEPPADLDWSDRKNIAFLAKPFRSRHLSAEIRRLLWDRDYLNG